MKRLWMMLLLVMPVNGFADMIPYSFTGAGGFSGSFSLDSSAPFTFNPNCPGSPESRSFGCIYQSKSALNSLSGSFGEFFFTGNPFLSIMDLPLDKICSLCQEWWIIRMGDYANPSPTLGEKKVVGLSLFIYAWSPSTIDGPTFTPPVPSVPDRYNFQYVVTFSDGTSMNDPLTSLTMNTGQPKSVSETNSFVFLLFGLAMASLGLKNIYK